MVDLEIEKQDQKGGLVAEQSSPKEIFVIFCEMDGKREAIGVTSKERNFFIMLKDCLLHNRNMIFYDPSYNRSSQIRALRQCQKKRMTPEMVNRHLFFGHVSKMLDEEGICTPDNDGILITSGPVAEKCRDAVYHIGKREATLEDYGLKTPV